MEEVIRYLFVGFGIGVLFMTGVIWFPVLRERKEDIKRRGK